MKNEMTKSVQDLKYQVLKRLMGMDLTDTVIYIRDEISNFTGGCIDHEVGGLCTTLLITSHDGGTITLEDDFGDDLGEVELENFGLELLITLL